jgi:hypothetical protein
MASPEATCAPHSRVGSLAATALAALFLITPAKAGTSPEIRTGAQNGVPDCVTPERLMAFLKLRNPRLDPRFRDIAKYYKTYGEAWRVRWDYAFFQMAVETNFLTYRTGAGRMGDVDPSQNNFAGIGTTGGGVPGDSFPDVKTGVHAQIQHLVVYSGERLALPLAPRTKLKQDEILLATHKVGRPMRFGDLARRWAVDKNYGASIEWVADSYRAKFCTGKEKARANSGLLTSNPVAKAETVQVAALPATPTRPVKAPNPAVRTIWQRETARAERRPAASPAVPVPSPNTESSPDAAEPALAQPSTFPEPSGLGASKGKCSLRTASYGGTKTVLIRAENPSETQFTTLRVLEGFEKSLTESFIRERAPGGVALGEFASEEEAIAKAREYCPA